MSMTLRTGIRDASPDSSVIHREARIRAFCDVERNARLPLRWENGMEDSCGSTQSLALRELQTFCMTARRIGVSNCYTPLRAMAQHQD
ncbi:MULTISPECIES: hypothetical protein [Xanthomonas]|uniref:hypothetical protein n=1 Tax=Xanthomonas TaxID=338 RepID=UPI0012904FEF|nr:MULTISPECIES: hypothetical protein [Xanthomonas]MEA9585769.1 hypothetical protein [Xanthomonas sp. WHRI 10064B]MEA9614196.1 hypothetical protein [Xanthomonas sp. WHRI 10064A]